MRDDFAGRAAPSVLIVDDMPANLELLSSMLREEGYTPRPVPSGRLALAAARAEVPDLVLLDIRMPRMDGFEVCERLKADEALKHIPVIFITAAHDAEDKVRAFSLGAVDYVTKPFQVKEVQARVRAHLELHRLRLDLEESRQAIIQTTLDGFWTVSPLGLLLEVNATYCRMSGYSEAELLAMSIGDLEDVESAGITASHIQEIISRGEDRFETRHRRKDGSALDLEISVQYRRSGGGRFICFMRDIGPRKRDEERLRRNLAEKEALLRELFHRTRNNMQVIMSILSFEQDAVRNPQVSAVVKRTNSRILSMSMAHMKLFEAQDLSSIDLGDYARDLIEILTVDKSFPAERIRITTSIQPVAALIDVAVPFGLLFHELVSNAFLHAFPAGERGEVKVDLARTADGDVELQVRDDGVGFSEHFDFRRDGKLGSVLIHGLVTQLNGRLTLNSGGGLSCSVSFSDSHIERRV